MNELLNARLTLLGFLVSSLLTIWCAIAIVSGYLSDELRLWNAKIGFLLVDNRLFIKFLFEFQSYYFK